MSTRYAVVDLETTGPKFNRGERIIQIGAVFVEDDQIVDEFSTLVQPLIPIPVHITQLTGISSQDVREAPLFEEIAPTLWEKLQGTVFVAHNINFDYKFLSQSFQRAGYPPLDLPGIDTVELIRVFYPRAHSYHLGSFCEEYGIELEQAHTAYHDARATADVLMMTKAKVQLLPSALMKQLRPYLSFLLRETGQFVNEWYNDRDDHHTLKGQTVGPFTFHQRGRDTKRPPKRTADFQWEDESRQIIRQNNDICLRKDQVRMVKALDLFIEQKQQVGFLSAYAGAGKSLAALYAAWRQTPPSHPIVIAVPTNALVDQMMNVTIPQLEALTGENIPHARLISADHYISLAGFQALLTFQRHNWGHLAKNAVLVTLGTLVWLFETETGRLEELNHGLQQVEYWRRVQTLAQKQDATISPFAEVDFAQKQWQEAAKARIIVTNQAYLIKHWDDLQTQLHFDKESVMVIDECHQLQSVIKEQLTPNLSLSHVQSLLQQTDHAIQTVEEALGFEQPNETITTSDDFYAAGFALEHLFESYHYLLDSLDDQYREDAVKKRSNHAYEQFLSTSAFHAAGWFLPLSELWVYGRNLKKALQSLFMNVKEYQLARTNRALHWQRLVSQWQQLEDTLEQLLLVDETSYLALKAEVKGENIAHYTLKKAVYQPKMLLEPLIQDFSGKWLMMSQALPIYRAFSQLDERFGVSDYWYQQIDPPKTYGATTTGYYFPDEPSMDKRNVIHGGAWLGKSLEQIYEHQRPGRIQVFFQSRELLQATEHWLSEQGSPALSFHIYSQHKGDYLPKLRQQFEQDSQGILLGLMSFGEGIHFEADVDRYVLTRLPFKAPDQADELAMNDWLTKHNRQYFRDYALPNMLVDLSQWLGRIWRMDGRENTLIVFDQRLLTSRYANIIKKVLPASFHCLPLQQTDLTEKKLD
ncbi:MAG: exonuclease domain-containing protein [Aerococcus sp.]|nr:exonuclease domain-containing protein [Aerococcus sp.]